MKMKHIVRLLCAVVLLATAAVPAVANEAQLWVFNTGLYLGYARAQIQLIGEPAEAEVRSNLNLARDSMRSAEQLFVGPLRAYREKDQCLHKAVTAIDNYEANTQNKSAAAKAGHIGDISWIYRGGLRGTYVSSRLDVVQYDANCDFCIFMIGYNYGQAWIASLKQGNRMRHHQGGWVYEMRAAIANGIKISVDKGNMLDGEQRDKICCCFGAKSEWESLPVLDRDSPVQMFENMLESIRAVVRNAGVAGCTCGGGEVEVPPPPPPPHPPQPAFPTDLSGAWGWENRMIISREENQYVAKSYFEFTKEYTRLYGLSKGCMWFYFGVEPQRAPGFDTPVYIGKHIYVNEKWGKGWADCYFELKNIIEENIQRQKLTPYIINPETGKKQIWGGFTRKVN